MSPAAGNTLKLGANCSGDGVTFRVWAPERRTVRVLLGAEGLIGQSVTLRRDDAGYFVGHDPEAKAGDLYRYYLDEMIAAPDPASRHQPFGVFGPSMIIDPEAYQWKCRSWLRPPQRGRVIYELHVGTFTPEGTFRGAMRRLDHLADLGVNTIELMPVHDFPGRWNWGYDGVMLYAPARCYGRPDDLRALVDAAHERGIAMVLDVVYNHFGATGNHLPLFSPHYFHRERETAWGTSLNFDGEQSGPVREFFVQNALSWLDEFRFDGLRLDATHAIHDRSSQHLMVEIRHGAHERGAFLIAEDERNDATVISNGGEPDWGFDGVWADDFHHTVRVGLTGERDGYLGSFTGTMDEWVETLRQGWYYRGQVAPHLGVARGTPAGELPPQRFVFCISNHDQVGNRALGDRLNHLVLPETYRAVSMLLCFTPYTPMLFMGQEWSASSPFLYFTDHPGELGRKMAHYRREEFKKVGINNSALALAHMPDPQAKTTFAASVLRWDETEKPPFSRCLALYRECLNLRARVPTFQNPPRETWRVEKLQLNRYELRDGAVTAVPASPVLAIRWQEKSGDWLLLVNLTGAADVIFSSHPFTQAGPGRHWEAVILSNDPKFAGKTGPDGLSIDRQVIKFAGAGAAMLRET